MERLGNKGVVTSSPSDSLISLVFTEGRKALGPLCAGYASCAGETSWASRSECIRLCVIYGFIILRR